MINVGGEFINCSNGFRRSWRSLPDLFHHYQGEHMYRLYHWLFMVSGLAGADYGL